MPVRLHEKTVTHIQTSRSCADSFARLVLQATYGIPTLLSSLFDQVSRPTNGVAMMWQVLTLSVLGAISVVQSDHHFCSSGYSRGQYLDASTKKYLLCWKVDWSDRSITFSAKVATTGWIGLGFSPTGFMPNSDVVIGWVKDGQGYLKVGTTPCFCIRSAAYSFVSQDRFATERLQPPIDDIQNVRLLSFSEADGMTTLEFKRDLEACEPKDRSIEVIPRNKKI